MAHQWRQRLEDPAPADGDRGELLSGKTSTRWTPESIHDFMHAKLVVADDVVFVGSFNFSRSGEKNAENVLEIHDATIADRLAAFIDDVRGATRERRPRTRVDPKHARSTRRPVRRAATFMLVLAAVACSTALATRSAGREGMHGLPGGQRLESARGRAPGGRRLRRIVNSIGPGRRCTPISAPACGTEARSESRSRRSALGQPKSEVSFEYADESRPGPVSDPGVGQDRRRAASRRRPACAHRRPRHCRLYELYALAPGRRPLDGGLRRDLGLRSNRLRPAVDLGRRSRPSDPPRPRPLRRGRDAGRIDHALRFTVSRTRRRTCGRRATWRVGDGRAPCRRWACGCG